MDLLAPNAPALEVLADRPRPPGVHYHSVIGVAPKCSAVVERWLAGDSNEPGDGVVPAASAHLDGVDSELIVPADHFHVHQHPLAVREVRRILLEHAAASGLPAPQSVRDASQKRRTCNASAKRREPNNLAIFSAESLIRPAGRRLL